MNIVTETSWHTACKIVSNPCKQQNKEQTMREKSLSPHPVKRDVHGSLEKSLSPHPVKRDVHGSLEKSLSPHPVKRDVHGSLEKSLSPHPV